MWDLEFWEISVVSEDRCKTSTSKSDWSFIGHQKEDRLCMCRLCALWNVSQCLTGNPRDDSNKDVRNNQSEESFQTHSELAEEIRNPCKQQHSGEKKNPRACVSVQKSVKVVWRHVLWLCAAPVQLCRGESPHLTVWVWRSAGRNKTEDEMFPHGQRDKSNHVAQLVMATGQRTSTQYWGRSMFLIPFFNKVEHIFLLLTHLFSCFFLFTTGPVCHSGTLFSSSVSGSSLSGRTKAAALWPEHQCVWWTSGSAALFPNAVH